MTNIIDLDAERIARLTHAPDTLAHLANTADALRDMLRLSAEAVTSGAIEDARHHLAAAALLMLGPGWEVKFRG